MDIYPGMLVCKKRTIGRRIIDFEMIIECGVRVRGTFLVWPKYIFSFQCALGLWDMENCNLQIIMIFPFGYIW